MLLAEFRGTLTPVFVFLAFTHLCTQPHTGKIGKSMAESCMVALSWVKAKSRDIAAWMGLHQVVVDLHRPDLDVRASVALRLCVYACLRA